VLTKRTGRAGALLGIAFAAGLLAAGCSSASTVTNGTGAPNRPMPSVSAAIARVNGYAKLLSKAAATMMASHSVHIVTVASDGSSNVPPLTITADVGEASGRATLTGSAGSMTTLLVHNVCYFKGDMTALTNFLQFRESIAKRLAGHWVALRPSDRLQGASWQLVSDSVSLSAVAGILRDDEPRRLSGPISYDEHVVDIITGTASNTADPSVGDIATTFYLDIITNQPVRYIFAYGTATGSGATLRSQTTYTFSGWGEAVRVTAPPDAIAASSIRLFPAPDSQGRPNPFVPADRCVSAGTNGTREPAIAPGPVSWCRGVPAASVTANSKQ
jgi:hypothetical protein